MPSPEDSGSSEQARPRRAGLLHVAKIIVSGLFMIGQSRDFGPNAPRISPVQLVVATLIGVAVLVGLLVMLVSFITR